MANASRFPFSSMGKAIPLVKATILNLVKSGSNIPKWVLTNFNDPSANVVLETADSEELKLAVQRLRFYGGGDTNEQALLGKNTITNAGNTATHSKAIRVWDWMD